jgi:hypothetical protein
MDLRIPNPRERRPLVEFIRALRSEHKFCAPSEGFAVPLIAQHPTAEDDQYVIKCSCGGAWTHPRLSDRPKMKGT